MPSDLLPSIVSLAPQVAIVALFLWFNLKSREEDRIEREQERKMELEKHEEFIKAISATTTAVEATTEAVTSGLQLTGKKILLVDKKVEIVDGKVDQIHKDHKEDKEIIKKMYEHAVKAYETKGKVSVSVTQ